MTRRDSRKTRPLHLHRHGFDEAHDEPSAIRFGPFQITTVLGSGAMATVYSGSHPTYGQVAIKVATDPRYAEELTREHAILHRFEHPGIPRPLGYLEVVGRPTLVMTHLSGRPMGKHMDLLSPRKTLALAISLLAVLDHVHRRGVVHCDVKPQNVLAGRQAQLLDFGIARGLNASSADAHGRVSGTPAYMAPEVLKGRTVSDRTDIYSLGVFLYRCLTARFPFPTDRALHLAAKEDLVWLPPTVLCPGIPEELDLIVRDMLHPDPGHRPPSGLLRARLREVAPLLEDRPSSVQGQAAEPGTTQRLSAELA